MSEVTFTVEECKSLREMMQKNAELFFDSDENPLDALDSSGRRAMFKLFVAVDEPYSLPGYTEEDVPDYDERMERLRHVSAELGVEELWGKVTQ